LSRLLTSKQAGYIPRWANLLFSESSSGSRRARGRSVPGRDGRGRHESDQLANKPVAIKLFDRGGHQSVVRVTVPFSIIASRVAGRIDVDHRNKVGSGCQEGVRVVESSKTKIDILASPFPSSDGRIGPGLRDRFRSTSWCRRTDDANAGGESSAPGPPGLVLSAFYWLERESSRSCWRDRSDAELTVERPDARLGVPGTGHSRSAGGEWRGRTACNERGWFTKGSSLRFGGRRHRIPAERFGLAAVRITGVWTTRSGQGLDCGAPE